MISCRSQTGFSLLEVLISTVIVSFLAVTTLQLITRSLETLVRLQIQRRSTIQSWDWSQQLFSTRPEGPAPAAPAISRDLVRSQTEPEKGNRVWEIVYERR